MKKPNIQKTVVIITALMVVVVLVAVLFKKDKIQLIDESGQTLTGEAGKFLKVEEEA